MQGSAITKANPVQFFWIQTSADFTPCMEACGGIGYSGVVTSTVVDGQLQWLLTLNGPNQKGVEARIGEVVVWDGTQLILYPDSQAFLALHTVT